MVFVPKSTHTVDVGIIDMGTIMQNVPASVFLNPQIPGFKKFDGISYIFLITHVDEILGPRQILFDLGTRKDWENTLAPRMVAEMKATAPELEPKLIVKDDAADILHKQGVATDSIEAIIWSHPHIDHVGDPSTFPENVTLVVGPGVNQAFFPGYPTKSDSFLLETDFANREVKELDFSTSTISIGGLRAIDYFADGSFYILDAPGHSIGHLMGLARTTEDTFLLLAGDAYHHPSQLRPSKNVPLPEQISIPDLDPRLCSRSVVMKLSPTLSKSEPFFGPGVVSHSQEEAAHVLRCLQAFDADENVFIIASHDLSLRPYIDVHPNRSNNWKLKGWKERSKWAFLSDLKDALELVT